MATWLTFNATTKELVVPKDPIIPFIQGDGIGPEIWHAAQPVFDTAVRKNYGTTKKIVWQEVLAGGKAYQKTGNYLPKETLATMKKGLVSIKGPLTTPIGKGFRSLNVQIRHTLDLFACVRPIHYFSGTPSPVKTPEKVAMTVFRENTEDIYAGIEFKADSTAAQELKAFLAAHDELAKVRFPTTSAFGIKPVSQEGTARLVIAAVNYALAHKLPTVTLVHKGNIMKYTEGGFKNWGYAAIESAFPEQVFTQKQYDKLAKISGKEAANEALKTAKKTGKVIINDKLPDNFLQQILLHPEDYSVIATLNLNGDYLSDALAAQVGGIGIAPGGNINYDTGTAVFEATHGTAPEFAGQNKLNPSSLLLSGAMLFDYLGWTDVATTIRQAIATAIQTKHVTSDFAQNLTTATTLGTQEFGAYLVHLINC
ncbi:NADP-dependent isocitrate dehydrogenase [Loigolactobacillus backii]|uniref:Isocitrate dehydrogenase [NADP] n=1 Tax=Loigolactobacillus backii TaxID=375175 RepID=A0A192GZS5_9LACO|nr:NADP-dependent isocitrate dehydrogenase [Loigolactobacillus backii]ANK60467.1 isocitrate dehydrogenase (NADP(+)) [Loigolactobacillus backii]ANK62034.1 isocitrate dehydrogenase (NADP(+)) [Loigolactobacillus backii]ANK65345.1 isocitrate dehydrogenase (NADP(+)) [Loigolactobacillus backii]ANK67897.1 isocitrate dehydrogenase (NADP(+)) [Loigolactobacillus backii]ANK68772.1 isocitrate dehydrogenase (NADP(+)) [Loigolactobacillus backii]